MKNGRQSFPSRIWAICCSWRPAFWQLRKWEAKIWITYQVKIAYLARWYLKCLLSYLSQLSENSDVVGNMSAWLLIGAICTAFSKNKDCTGISPLASSPAQPQQRNEKCKGKIQSSITDYRARFAGLPGNNTRRQKSTRKYSLQIK